MLEIEGSPPTLNSSTGRLHVLGRRCNGMFAERWQTVFFRWLYLLIRSLPRLLFLAAVTCSSTYVPTRHEAVRPQLRITRLPFSTCHFSPHDWCGYDKRNGRVDAAHATIRCLRRLSLFCHCRLAMLHEPRPKHQDLLHHRRMP
jgi:hypothetical protein